MKSAPSNLSNWKILLKKMPKCENKYSLFYQQCLIFVFLGWNLKKNYCHIWNQDPQIYLFSNLPKKAKMLKCVTKNGRFRYFRTRIWKQYSHIWNPLPRICVIAKFFRKAKMPKLTTKNAIFVYFWPKNILPRYFWARILKNHCQTWNELLLICLIAKFFEYTEMPIFGTKYAIFGCFWPKLSYFGIFGQEF